MVNAVWTPMAAKYEIGNFDKFKFNIETDFNIGYDIRHVGKPSDYSELADEIVAELNTKQWLKFNLNALDTIIYSLIFEFTLFEIHPLDIHYWTK